MHTKIYLHCRCMVTTEANLLSSNIGGLKLYRLCTLYTYLYNQQRQLCTTAKSTDTPNVLQTIWRETHRHRQRGEDHRSREDISSMSSVRLGVCMDGGVRVARRRSGWNKHLPGESAHYITLTAKAWARYFSDSKSLILPLHSTSCCLAHPDSSMWRH